MTYFDQKEWMSNSEFKRWMARAGLGIPEVPNLDRIFDFGNFFEDILLQPGKFPRYGACTPEEIERAKAMVITAHKDPILQKLFNMPDFRVQHEWYRYDVFGVKGKAKTDGDSKMLDMVFELKSIAVKNQNQFREAVDHFGYDQGAAWYLRTARKKFELITGVSKVETSQLFKLIVQAEDNIYKEGVKKIEKAMRVINQFVGDLGLNEIAA